MTAANSNRTITRIDPDTGARITETYDANGYVQTEAWDFDWDEKPDEIFTFTHDANGNLLNSAHDSNGDGKPEHISTIAYDARGNLQTGKLDNNGNGETDEILTFTLGPAYNQLTAALDSDADGNPDQKEIWTFDAGGENKISEVILRDTDDDGTFDRVEYRNFDTEVDTIEPTAQSAQDLAGVQTITLSDGATNLVISDSVLSVLAGGDDSYRVQIEGDEHDSVHLGQGIRDSGQDVEINGEQYDLYTGTAGSVLVDPDVAVELAVA
ncbi:hypothetical protein [Ruegeria atlantica]|uniref:hypothetical protein n=1 Tax=Ruegeria atlantica TaxID=81569 RepID=UPI00147AF07C|nr:hypothetical protein [Ruegeria atlantica]